MRRWLLRHSPLLALLLSIASGMLTVASAPAAHARRTGIAGGDCEGCHEGGTIPNVTLTAEPLKPSVGATVLLTLRVSRTNGNTAGFYLTSNFVGELMPMSGQSTRLSSATEIVHSAPNTSSSGDVTFQMQWKAPTTAGGVDFEAWALSANGNNAKSGDAEGFVRFSMTYGCAGIDAFVDNDSDGVGGATTTRVCEIGPGSSAMSGDCNEADERSYPMAPERCNGSDDNCDGKVDEGESLCGLSGRCVSGFCVPTSQGSDGGADARRDAGSAARLDARSDSGRDVGGLLDSATADDGGRSDRLPAPDEPSGGEEDGQPGGVRPRPAQGVGCGLAGNPGHCAVPTMVWPFAALWAVSFRARRRR